MPVVAQRWCQFQFDVAPCVADAVTGLHPVAFSILFFNSRHSSVPYLELLAQIDRLCRIVKLRRIVIRSITIYCIEFNCKLLVMVIAAKIIKCHEWFVVPAAVPFPRIGSPFKVVEYLVCAIVVTLVVAVADKLNPCRPLLVVDEAVLFVCSVHPDMVSIQLSVKQVNHCVRNAAVRSHGKHSIIHSEHS